MKRNIYSFFSILVICGLFALVTFAGDKFKIDKNVPLQDAYPVVLSFVPYNIDTDPVVFTFPLDPGFTTDSISLGPEILTGLSGFYDYKTNGESNKYIQVEKNSPNYVHVIDMQADSSDPTGQTLRWTKYCESSDGGLTWGTPIEVPGAVRSGYPVLNYLNSGAAIIANHTTDGGSRLDAVLYNEVIEHSGSFLANRHPNENINPFGIWPQICVYGSGNVGLISRRNVNSTNPPETLYYSFWNGSVMSNRTPIYITGMNFNGTVGSNMRFNLASNGGNIATAVAAPVNANDTLGTSRVYFTTTTDAGSTWSTPRILFTPYTENNGEDTIQTSGGSGFIYKNGTNKWFYVYPVSADGFYSSAKLFITKSTDGGNTLITSSIVTAAQVGASSTYNKVMVFCFNIDFPTLGWSNDGSTLYCAYHVVVSDTGATGFNSRDLFIQYSLNEGTTWSNPIRITNTPDIDESYPSLSDWNKGSTGNPYEVNLVYMKDPGVGPRSYNGSNPASITSRNYQVFRKLSGLPPIGIKSIGGEIPNEYRLEQNYPNPFNPSTLIRFSVPKTSLVRLTVYDILGREINVLINEVKQMGNYSINWNAANYPSGIYFYTISTEGFSETRKMILVK